MCDITPQTCLRVCCWVTSLGDTGNGELGRKIRTVSSSFSSTVCFAHQLISLGRVETAPCRCQIHLEGLEWFLYNRTPSFDAIVERMQEAEKKERSTDPSGKDASMDESDVDHSETAEAQGDNETIRTSRRGSTQRSDAAEQGKLLPCGKQYCV